MSDAALTPPAAWRDLPFFAHDLPAIDAQLLQAADAVLPPRHQIFAALERVSPEAAKVVILGQDPYPTPGHAHGFAFSAAAETSPLPRSLTNIYKEMRADIHASPKDSDIRFWADQGVLLLNTALTVPAGKAGGHARLGWDRLTAQILERLSTAPRAYLLWGAHAHRVARDVDGEANLKIETAHPSPLSARRGFFGSRPFSRTNAWLQAHGHQAINWANPPEAS